MKMKTITFYSFKGGTGRSLAVAQLAVVLARFGKSVFVIDFDFEAPGLPEKFRCVADVPTYDFGLLDHINAFRDTGEMKFDKPLKTMKISSGISKTGVIHLLPAGNSFSPDLEYWRDISNPRWREFMSFCANNRDFFTALIDTIEDQFEADYLLIDSRSGVNELGGICTRLLADTVVFLSVNHLEGLLGSNLLLRSHEKAREDNEEAPDEAYFILSRIPYYYIDEGRPLRVSDDELDTMKVRASDIINRDLKDHSRINTIYTLRSEPRLEIKEHLQIEFTGFAKNSILSKDYMEFFSDLIPDISDGLKNVISEEVEVYRPFMLVEDRGRMINPEDRTRNVAFRVDTLVTTFSSIYETAYNGEKERILRIEKRKGVSGRQVEAEAKKQAERIASESLFEAGRSAAQGFGKFLRISWTEKKIKDESIRRRKAKLDDWCEFDSTVGFGKFENFLSSQGGEGEIRLINNFLVYNRPKRAHNLCAFMAGYITCVLNAVFSPDSVSVEHDLDKHCGQYQESDPKVCVFPFKVPSKILPVKR